MYARLVIAVNDANRPTKRLAGIFALVVEGPGGRPLAMVPDVCLLRLYRNVPQRHGRTRKLDRLASEAALDNALARLEREGWLRLVGRSKRREE